MSTNLAAAAANRQHYRQHALTNYLIACGSGLPQLDRQQTEHHFTPGRMPIARATEPKSFSARLPPIPAVQLYELVNQYN